MIQPNERPVSEMRQMVAGLDIEISSEMTEAMAEAGREYINKMRDAGNVVMQNPYGEPIAEIIAPRGFKDEIEPIFDEWDLNPSGHGVHAQAPSFSDDRPEVSKGLTAWQFLLTDDDGEEIDSCGYDLEQIIQECEDMDEPFLYTKAPRFRCSLPVE